MDLIIQPEEVGLLSRPISPHVNREEIVSYINEVEQLQIRSSLGDALFYHVKDNPEDFWIILEGGIDRTGEVNGGIKKATAYYVYAKYISEGATIPTRFGAVEKTDEYSERIQHERKRQIMRECNNIADAYMVNVIKYAKAKGWLNKSSVNPTRRIAYTIGDEICGNKEGCRMNINKIEYIPDFDAGDGINIEGKVIGISFVKDLGEVDSRDVAEEKALEFASDKNALLIRYTTSLGEMGTIRQVYTAKGYSLQYLTIDGDEFVRSVNYDNGTNTEWYNIDKANLVYKLMYKSNIRSLGFHDPLQNEEFGNVILPEATIDEAGLMSAIDKMNAERIVYLGSFSRSSEAEAKAVEYAKDRNKLFLLYDIENGQNGIIEQLFSNTAATIQYLYLNGSRYIREVRWAIGEVSSWQNVTGSERISGLSFDAETRKLSLKDALGARDWGSVTIPIAESNIPENLTTIYTVPMTFFGAGRSGIFQMKIPDIGTRNDIPRANNNKCNLVEAKENKYELNDGIFAYLRDRNIGGEQNATALITVNTYGGNLLSAEIAVSTPYKILLFAKIASNLAGNGHYLVVYENDYREQNSNA